MINEKTNKKYRKRLDSVNNIIKYMANIVHQLDEDVLTIDKAKALGYLCNIMIKSIETCEFETRLEELEKNMLEKQDND